jgi:hypothetical protein
LHSHPETAKPCIRVQEAAITRFHAKYFAHELTKRCASNSIQKLAASLADAHDDYSLKIENLPKAPPKPGQIDLI